MIAQSDGSNRTWWKSQPSSWSADGFATYRSVAQAEDLAVTADHQRMVTAVVHGGAVTIAVTFEGDSCQQPMLVK